MKKIFIAIMAVAAAVSCSQELTVDAPKGAAIAFDNAFVENSTRAAVDLTKGNFDFGVYGTVANASGNGLIFTNQPVAADGTYSPVQYWVANATYTFTAYAPLTDAQWTYAPATGTSSEAYNGTLSFDNAAAEGEQDLIFAAAESTTPATIESAPAAVGLTFGHLLSKVAFKFTNIFTDENISLNVYGVKINNAAAEGTLPVVDGATEEWTGTGDYVRAFGAADASAAAALANGASLTTEHYYLIPVERDYEITFNVGLYQAGVLLNTYEHKIYATLNLEKGKSYSLNATLAAENVNPESQLFPIEFKVDGVEDWTEGNVTIVAEHEVATAAELAAAVAEGGSILLTQDINLDATLSINKDTTLDLNGKTLTIAAKDATVVDLKNYGKMNLINGKIAAGNAEASRRCVYNYGEMTINNVEFVQTYGAKGAAINNEAKMTIENATVNSVYYAIWNSGANADLVVNGGTFNCVGNNDTWKPSNDSVAWCYAVTNRNGAKMTVNGGYFSGNHGVIAAYEGSKVTLNAGTYECFATMSGVSDWVLYAYGDGAAVKYSADCDLKHATKAADACCTTEANGVVAQF